MFQRTQSRHNVSGENCEHPGGTNWLTPLQ